MLLQVAEQSPWSFLLFMLMWFIFIFFFQEIQLLRYLGNIGRFVTHLSTMLASSMHTVMSRIEQSRRDDVARSTIEERLKRLMEFAIITPTSLEPIGLVSKLKNIILEYSRVLEREVSSIMTDDRTRVQNYATAVSVLREMNWFYKVIDHYYRQARKYKNYFLVIQLSSLLPMLKELSDIMNDAVNSFLKGVPIGDSAGPLVAFLFERRNCGERRVYENVEDTHISECTWQGRKVFVVKARGPGSTVGRLDDAIRFVVDTLGAKPRYIITVDAALRLESEQTGAISEGIGVAMGGIGVEKFNIETIASRYGIPLYAFLIKMKEQEALTAMNRQIYTAVNDVVKRVESFIVSNIGVGDSAVLIGVGNTVGVAQ